MTKSLKFLRASFLLAVFMISGICRVALADAASPEKWDDLRWVNEKWFKDKISSNYKVRYDYYSKASKKERSFEEYKKMMISGEAKNVTTVGKVVDILDTDNPIYKIVINDAGNEVAWKLEDNKWKMVLGLTGAKGMAAFEAGKFAEALPLLIKGNELNPYNSRIKFILSNTYSHSTGTANNNELALQYAKEAVDCLKYTKDTWMPFNAFFNLGLLYRQSNNKELEQKYLKMALAANTSGSASFVVHYFYAASLGEKCDYPNYDKDLAQFKADYKDNPKNPLNLDLFDKDPIFKKIVTGQ